MVSDWQGQIYLEVVLIHDSEQNYSYSCMNKTIGQDWPLPDQGFGLNY